MKKPSQHLIARSVSTLGDVWSHYCTLNEKGEAVDRGRFRTSPKGVEKWFTDLPPARIAMEDLLASGSQIILLDLAGIVRLAGPWIRENPVFVEDKTRFAPCRPSGSDAGRFSMVHCRRSHAIERKCSHGQPAVARRIGVAKQQARSQTGMLKQVRSAWCTKAELSGNVDSENNDAGSSTDI
jgi:hypothetical protein